MNQESVSLLPLTEVTRRTGCAKSKIYASVREGSFPRPVKVGTASRWSSREIDEWIASQIAMRDARSAEAA